MTLNLQHFFTSPLEAVKVTAENMEEVAAWCGGTIAHDENPRTKVVSPYVWVPTPEGTKISWAYKNMWITRRCVISMKGEIKFTFSVFRPDYFKKNYFDSPAAAVDATWEKAAQQRQGKKKPAKKAPEPTVNNITVNVDPAVMEQIAGMQKQIEELSHSIGVDQKVVADSIIETTAGDEYTHNHEIVIVDDLLEMEPETCPACQFMLIAATEFSKNLGDRYAGSPIVTPMQHGSSEHMAEELVKGHLGVTNAQIDALHGPGAASALDRALGDGTVFADNKEAFTEMAENPIDIIATETVYTQDSVDESDRELPSVLEGKSEAEVEQILNGEEVEIAHLHSSEDGCDLHNCEMPRYPSGPAKLIFTDKTFAVSPHGSTVEIAHEEITLDGQTVHPEVKVEVDIHTQGDDVEMTEAQIAALAGSRAAKLMQRGQA